MQKETFKHLNDKKLKHIEYKLHNCIYPKFNASILRHLFVAYYDFLPFGTLKFSCYYNRRTRPP